MTPVLLTIADQEGKHAERVAGATADSEAWEKVDITEMLPQPAAWHIIALNESLPFQSVDILSMASRVQKLPFLPASDVGDSKRPFFRDMSPTTAIVCASTLD